MGTWRWAADAPDADVPPERLRAVWFKRLMHDDELFGFIRTTLGAADLRTTPVEVASELPVGTRSRAFLATVGLPAEEVGPGVSFNLVETLPAVPEAYRDTRFRFGEAWRNTRMLRLWCEIGTYLNLADGSVWELVPERAAEASFVNSSVEMLGYFLAEWNRPGGPWKLPDEEVRAALELLVQRLREADPDAFDDDGANFWPTVIGCEMDFL
jgi:hypothetical protein